MVDEVLAIQIELEAIKERLNDIEEFIDAFKEGFKLGMMRAIEGSKP